MVYCQEFSVVTVKKEDRIEGALKANYKTKKYGFTGTFGSTGLVRTYSLPKRFYKTWLPLLAVQRADVGGALHVSLSLHVNYASMVFHIYSCMLFSMFFPSRPADLEHFGVPQVSTSVAVYSVAPGLDVTLFGTLPDVQGSAKVIFPYGTVWPFRSVHCIMLKRWCLKLCCIAAQLWVFLQDTLNVTYNGVALLAGQRPRI